MDIYKDPTDWVDSLVEGSLPTAYELMELNSGEQAFMTTRPKLIQAGYTTLDKGSGTRFYCPALKGKDSRTQEKVSKWIQLLHKHPAHLHALDIKDAQPQRDPGIKPLAGMTMSKLMDKYTITRNMIRNQIILLRGQAEKPFSSIK